MNFDLAAPIQGKCYSWLKVQSAWLLKNVT